jgi:hypothetical protein
MDALIVAPRTHSVRPVFRSLRRRRFAAAHPSRRAFARFPHHQTSCVARPIGTARFQHRIRRPGLRSEALRLCAETVPGLKPNSLSFRPSPSALTVDTPPTRRHAF